MTKITIRLPFPNFFEHDLCNFASRNRLAIFWQKNIPQKNLPDNVPVPLPQPSSGHNHQIFNKMKEFALIFRLKDISDFKPSPEQMQERMNWLAGIAAQNKLVDKGNTLLPAPGSAKTVRPDDVVTDGPYTEIKEFISGYIVVKAETIDEAVEMATSNPIFRIGGNIEVREVLKRD